MGIYVACTCGQAFSARPDLAGQTLRCPNCGGPIAIPRSQGASPLDPLLPTGSYVVPQPTAVRPPATRNAPVLADPLAAPAVLPTSPPARANTEGLPPIVIYASIAAGSAIVALLCVVGVQMMFSAPAGPPPQVVQQPQAQPFVQQHPVYQPPVQQPPAIVPAQPAPAAPARAPAPGWTRKEIAGGVVSVEFPPGVTDGISRQRDGVATEGRTYSNGTNPTLILAHFKGPKVAEAANNVEKFAQLTGSIAVGTQPKQLKIDGYDAIEILDNHYTGYARHRFIFIAEDEMVLISGKAEYPTTRAEAEYFVQSLQIKKPSALQSLLPKFRWPLSGDSK